MTARSVDERADNFDAFLKGRRARSHTRDLPVVEAEGEAPPNAPTEGLWPAPLDLRELAARDPEPPPMIIDDWLPAGYATMLAGHGGAGKSGIALQLAAHIAMGREWCGLPVEQRRVLYLSCEDRERVLHWRLRRICDHAGICLADLAGRLQVLDLVGCDTVVFGRMPPMPGAGLTAAYLELKRVIEQADAEVVIIDGVTDAYGGSENDRAEVKRFVNALVRLIQEDRGAVLLVAHVNKATTTASATSEGYSGSTGWHNAVRARWYLRPEKSANDDEGTKSAGDMLLELQKSNLGASDQTIRFRWSDDSHVFTGRIESASTFESRLREARERDGILAALREVVDSGDYCPAATTGRRTAFHVLAASPNFPETLRAGNAARARFWRHVEMLRRNGEIAEGSIRRANRHGTPTLVPKASNDAGCADAPNESEAPPFGSTQDAPASMRRMTQGVIGGRVRTEAGATGVSDPRAARVPSKTAANSGVGGLGRSDEPGDTTADPPPCTAAAYSAAKDWGGAL